MRSGSAAAVPDRLPAVDGAPGPDAVEEPVLVIGDCDVDERGEGDDTCEGDFVGALPGDGAAITGGRVTGGRVTWGAETRGTVTVGTVTGTVGTVTVGTLTSAARAATIEPAVAQKTTPATIAALRPAVTSTPPREPSSVGIGIALWTLDRKEIPVRVECPGWRPAGAAVTVGRWPTSR
jgi:hypothetical protein